MDHVAIMKTSWKLLPKIISGEKKIESRWYKTRCEAWGKVKARDTVYFKDSGEPVTVKAGVSKVMEFKDLDALKVREIIHRYGGKDGIGSSDLEYFCDWAKDKKYCILIFLSHPSYVTPFAVDKAGFGSARAWISIENINRIKIKNNHTKI